MKRNVRLTALSLCFSLVAFGADAATRETPPPDDVEVGDESEPFDAPAVTVEGGDAADDQQEADSMPEREEAAAGANAEPENAQAESSDADDDEQDEASEDEID